MDASVHGDGVLCWKEMSSEGYECVCVSVYVCECVSV